MIDSERSLQANEEAPSLQFTVTRVDVALETVLYCPGR